MEKRTAVELEQLVMARLAAVRECEGCDGVSVIGIADERVPYNWAVSHARNATAMCMDAIERIVAQMQKVYELRA